MNLLRFPRWLLIAMTFLVASLRLVGADPAWLPPVRTLAGWLDPRAPKPPAVQFDLELAGIRGIAPGVTGMVASVAFHLPTRFQLDSIQPRGRVQLLRHGGSLWLWEAHRRRWCRTLLPSDAPAPGFPTGEMALNFLAHGSDAESLPSRRVEGHPCSVFRVHPAAAVLGLASDFQLTLWVPQSSNTPLALRWQDRAAGLDFTAWLRRVRVTSSASSIQWIPQPAAGPSVEVLEPEAFIARVPEPIRFVATELGVIPVPGS